MVLPLTGSSSCVFCFVVAGVVSRTFAAIAFLQPNSAITVKSNCNQHYQSFLKALATMETSKHSKQIMLQQFVILDGERTRCDLRRATFLSLALAIFGHDRIGMELHS